MKAKTLLNKPEKWCKLHDEWRGRYCLRGALIKCYGGVHTKAYSVAAKKIRTAISEYAHKRAVRPSITLYNDNLKTMFKDIRAVLKLANV